MGYYLVVANQTLASGQLMAKLEELHASDPDARFRVIVPAARDVDADHALAASEHVRWPGEAMVVTAERMRLKTGLTALADLGIEAEGDVVTQSPYQAVVSACEHTAYDAVIVSTLPAGVSRWLGMDLPNRLRRKLDVPVTHVESEATAQA